MKKAIELKLIEIASKMQELEGQNPLAFTTVEWKVLHGQRTILAEILQSS